MKRFLLFILCMCLFLCSCGKDDRSGYYMEEEITTFVQEHEEELRQQIEDAGPNDRIREFAGTESIEDRRDAYGIIYYEYAFSGILSSSLQAGFYYSAEDMPSPHGGTSWAGGYGWPEVPSEKENLWRYEEDQSDNYLITRKICDNFYYVVAGN